MAFCPLCGKQLPPNGICSCGGRSADAGSPADESTMLLQRNPGQPAPGQPLMNQPLPNQQQFGGQQAPYQQASRPLPNQQVPNQQQVPYQQVPYQQAPYQQAPYQQQAPRPMNNGGYAPSGTNAFTAAFKTFAKVFVKPGEASQDPLTGKVSLGSGFVLAGIYFFIVWWSLVLLLIGSGIGFLGPVSGISGSKVGSFKFLPAFGWGALGAVLFCSLRVGTAGLIKAFSGNPNVPFTNILTACFVDTVIPECILFIMMLFQFATFYFAVFFYIIYLGIIVYQHSVLLRRVSGKNSSNKRFWAMVTILSEHALVIMLCYMIFLNVIRKSVG